MVDIVEQDTSALLDKLEQKVADLEAKLDRSALFQSILAEAEAKVKAAGLVLDTDADDVVAKLEAVGIVKKVEEAEVKVEGFFARLHAELGKVVDKIEEVPEELKGAVEDLYAKLKAHL